MYKSSLCLGAGQAAPLPTGTTPLALPTASSPVSMGSTQYFIMLFTKNGQRKYEFCDHPMLHQITGSTVLPISGGLGTKIFQDRT